MSSNIQIKRICDHCNAVFMAKTTVTRFCSHRCNSRAHKARIKQLKVQVSNQQTGQAITGSASVINDLLGSKTLISVKELSALSGLSQRTLFRVMKDESFPKLKVGKRLLFPKESVINYMNSKFGTL